MKTPRNIGYLLLLATSLGIVFAVTTPGVSSPADARSDACKIDPGSCLHEEDKGYKCAEQARKDGVETPEEQEKCERKDLKAKQK